MKILTGFAVINRAEGKRIAYTYSEVDEVTGNIIEDNIKESFIGLDDKLLKNVTQIEKYINENKIK